MLIQESGEMYLESIYRLSETKSQVRAIDIGEYMGYSKPSVSRAMGLLKKGGYINVDKDGSITLTESGRTVAEKIFARHTLIAEMLVQLGVNKETAADDACKIEHVISDESFDAIKKYVNSNNSSK